MFRSVMPIELRPLRAILARLSERSPEETVGSTISDWCQREGLALAAETSVRTATTSLTNAFFSRAPALLTQRVA